MSQFHSTRRAFLAGAGTFAAWSFAPAFASQGPSRDPRFLQVILRGGMDGLAVAEPTFEPRLETLRSGILIGQGRDGAGLQLDGNFILNPKLETLHSLYSQGQASIFHAVASPYRGRSHFAAQDVLESGAPGSNALTSGWMNRAMSTLGKGGRVESEGLAIGSVVPLLMRGEAPILTWNGPGHIPSGVDATDLLSSLYAAEAPKLQQAFQRGLKLNRIAGEGAAHKESDDPSSFVNGMEMIGRLFSKPDGPRIGMIDLSGWDTHATEEPEGENLGAALSELDKGIAALRAALGENWNDTVVSVTTEFGRTVAINGTEGTDHGTATVAFLLGGGVNGGKVIADWPGLKENNLFEGRDLLGTTDVRAIWKGVLRDHLGVNERALSEVVFPESGAVKALDSLVV